MTSTDTGPDLSPPAAAAAPGFTEPELYSAAEIAAKTEAIAAATEPALLPPSVAGAEAALAAAVEGITATWRSAMTVTAMWSINETRNAWMHVSGLGWRKLFNGRDGAFAALVALASQARQTGRQITFREEADGMVYEIYLW